MVAMSGKTVIKIPRITIMMTRTKIIKTTARDMETKTMVDLMSTDVPKEMNGNPPEKGTMTEETVGPETIKTRAANMNSIASTIARIKAEIQRKKHLAQKC